jgi:hypothetical protein
MIITSTNAVYYLIERGFLTYESAVDGDLMIVNGSSNHRNIKVIRKKNPGYFIKQVKKWELPAIGSIQREAACYWLGHNDDDFASINSLLPKYYDYDFNKHLLIVELLPDGETLFQCCLRAGACPAELALQLGRSLGVYHSEAGAKMKQGAQASILTKSIPWILTVHQQPAAQSSFNASSQELLVFIQSNPQFYYNLETLRQRWRYESFIHGDIKLDNYIIEPQPGGEGDDEGGKLSFKVIDWELAGFGDGGWDLGSAFQMLLTFPILSLPAVTAPLPTDLQGLLRLCSDEMRSAVRQLWIGYAGTLQNNGNASGELLERSVKYCAARMMQTAFELTETLNGGEAAYFSDLLRAKAFCLLLVALDVLQNPINALRHLFTDEQQR